MADRDTVIGGGQRNFPSTCWSRFAGMREADLTGRRSALEELSLLYWKPIYAYIRTRSSASNEEAKDLTQDFFAWMLQEDFLARADSGRGRFRSFVKVALDHFLADEHRRRGSLKRGGDRQVFRFGAAAEGMDGADLPDGRAASPESALDDAWREELLTRAEKELERRLRNEGQELSFRVFRDYFLAEAADPVYRDIAARHGIAESDVHNHLRLAKKRYRAVLAELVLETVSDEQELEDEMKTLFGKDGP